MAKLCNNSMVKVDKAYFRSKFLFPWNSREMEDEWIVDLLANLGFIYNKIFGKFIIK